MYKVYLGENTPTEALFMKGVLSQGEALDIKLFGDGLELLCAIQEEPPDLVISDVVLPGLGGLALARFLKFHQSTKDIPLLLVSGIADEHLSSLESHNVDAYLQKPLDVPKLREMVADLLT